MKKSFDAQQWVNRVLEGRKRAIEDKDWLVVNAYYNLLQWFIEVGKKEMIRRSRKQK